MGGFGFLNHQPLGSSLNMGSLSSLPDAVMHPGTLKGGTLIQRATLYWPKATKPQTLNQNLQPSEKENSWLLGPRPEWSKASLKGVVKLGFRGLGV